MYNEDDSKYDFLPFMDRNLGRVFVPGDKTNTRLFIRDFRATEFGSRLVSEGLDTGENLDAILEAAQERFDRDEINMTEFSQVAKSLWMLGDLKPKPAPVAPVAAPKQLSASQQAWSEFRQYTESHSVAECKARARADEGYRKFLNTNLQREMAQAPVGDGVVSIGTQATRQDRGVKITQALNDFAVEFRQMSSDEVRKRRNIATNAHAAEFNRSLDLAISAGLL
jgi:hypothetical protein